MACGSSGPLQPLSPSCPFGDLHSVWFLCPVEGTKPSYTERTEKNENRIHQGSHKPSNRATRGSAQCRTQRDSNPVSGGNGEVQGLFRIQHLAHSQAVSECWPRCWLSDLAVIWTPSQTR